jgi:hypothetical protein
MNCTWSLALHLGYRYEDEKISDVATNSRASSFIGGQTLPFSTSRYVYATAMGKKRWSRASGLGGLRLGRIDYFVQRKSGRSLPMAVQ